MPPVASIQHEYTRCAPRHFLVADAFRFAIPCRRKGAISVVTLSSLSIGGTTAWTGNRAGADGGNSRLANGEGNCRRALGVRQPLRDVRNRRSRSYLPRAPRVILSRRCWGLERPRGPSKEACRENSRIQNCLWFEDFGATSPTTLVTVLFSPVVGSEGHATKTKLHIARHLCVFFCSMMNPFQQVR